MKEHQCLHLELGFTQRPGLSLQTRIHGSHNPRAARDRKSEGSREGERWRPSGALQSGSGMSGSWVTKRKFLSEQMEPLSLRMVFEGRKREGFMAWSLSTSFVSLVNFCSVESLTALPLLEGLCCLIPPGSLWEAKFWILWYSLSPWAHQSPEMVVAAEPQGV